MGTRQKILLCLLGAVLVFASFRAYQIYSTFHQSSALSDTKNLTKPIKKAPLAAKFISPIVNVPAKEMLAYYRGIYRLKPDVRFVGAIPEIDHFLSGESKQQPDVSFPDGKWNISYKGKKVGELPELPDFSDWNTLLISFAREVNKEHPFTINSGGNYPEMEAESQKFSAGALFRVLESANQKWQSGDHHAALLKLSSSALTQLCFLGVDETESTTPLRARTMALIALTQALTTENVQSEVCLFSHLTGYSRYAFQLAETLPAKDPIRMYARLEDAPLREIAYRPESHAMVKALWIERLAQKFDGEGWTDFSKSLPRDHSLYSLELRGATKIPHEHDRPYLALPYAAYAELKEDPGIFKSAASVPLRQLGKDFENTIVKRAFPAGPFCDSELFADFYHAYFYSGFFLNAKYWMRSGALYEETNFQSLLEQLDPNAGEFGKEFYQWLSHLVDFKKKSIELLPRLVDDLSSFPLLGAAPLQMTYDQMSGYLNSADMRLFQPAVHLVKRMDSRPAHRYYLAGIAYHILVEPRLAEKFCMSYAAVTSDSDLVRLSVQANLISDQNLVKKILHGQNCGVECRALILWHLMHQKPLDPQFVRSEFESFIHEYPQSWTASVYYIDFLRDTGDMKHASQIIESWIKHYGTAAGMDGGLFHAYMRLSYTYYLMGDFDKAWNNLQPIDSGRPDVDAIKGLILEGRGHHEEAERVLRAAVATSPNDREYQMDLVEVLWRNEKYAEAAEVLRKLPYMNPSSWCSEVAPKFSSFYQTRPLETAMKAIQAMVDANLGQGPVGCVMRSTMAKKEYELTYAIYTLLESRSFNNVNENLIAFNTLKAWKGKETAIEWLKKKYPADKRTSLIVTDFELRTPELLWDFVPTPDESENGQWIWVIRVNEVVAYGLDKDSHAGEVEQHYKNPSSKYPEAIGHFLLGHITEDQLLSYAINDARRTEIAYFIGYKAQLESRYEDASDWYHVAVQNMNYGNRYFDIALKTLESWNLRGIPFSRVVAKKL